MSFNVVPKLSFASALSVSVSLYFNDALHSHGAVTVSLLTAAENVDLLPLPENLKKEILCLIQPIGEQIQAWLQEFQSALAGHRNLHRKLRWTSLGIVDYGRTAGNCASSGEWDDVEAFKLACGGSSPESIYRLWPIVKNDVLEEISQSGLVVEKVSKRLLLWFKFWVSYLSGQMDEFRRVNSFNDCTDDEYFLFKLAVKNNNVGAARFFLEKLKNRCGLNELIMALAKECLLLRRWDFNPSIFIFLVSHLNGQEVRALFPFYKNEGLILFLSWPLLQFFVPMTELMGSDYDFSRDAPELLERILIKIMQTHVPVAYESIFKALWLKTTPFYQREFFDSHTYYILCNLFEGYSPEKAIRALFKGNRDAYQKFLCAFIPNANAVMSMSVEDNNAKAFENILQQYFVKDLVENFENVYAKYTQAYVNEYYGNEISSESLSDTE